MAQLSIKKTLAKLLDNKSMIDRFYPVGSYYETSNTSFDPNTAWGGTWVKEAEGKVHVSAGSTYTAGSSYGSNTHTHTTSGHTLTVDEMPSHNHTATITTNTTYANGTNWAKVSTSGTSGLGVGASVTIGNKGGGKSHSHGDTGSSTRNSWQPSIAVVRWHRTA